MNGITGDGSWFYNMVQNAISSDDIFDENNNFVDYADELVNDPVRNGFIKIKYHWSEDPGKDENWYLEQKRDLNFDTRKINQELDLLFVGSTSCIFSDEFLGELKPSKPVDRIRLPHGTHFNLFTHRSDLDKTDYYILGCDTAKSLVGDFNALELYSYSSFVQVGEYFGRLGSLTKYADVVKALIKVLAPIFDNRLLVAVENNSIGTAIIEALENANDFDYMQYMYSPNKDKLGIYTSPKTKSQMISFLYDYIVDEPHNIKSSDLIDQLNIIERKSNGSISARSGSHDDLFMASALCAYTKKLSSLDIEPLLGFSTVANQQSSAKLIQTSLAATNVRIDARDNKGIGVQYNTEDGGLEYIIYDTEDEPQGSDYFSLF